MAAYGEVKAWLHVFLISALDGGELSASRPWHFNPGQGAPGTVCIGGCLDPRALEKT